MTGLEILFLLGGAFTAAGLTLSSVVFMQERRKRLFVGVVQYELEAPVVDVESGDIALPLSFTVGDVHVSAALRGDVEVWQLSRTDAALDDARVAVVYEDWHAPDVHDLSDIGPLTSRLELFADDVAGGRRLLLRARADLASVLGRGARRCVVGGGRAFLEVTRRGLMVEELREALVRFRALLAIVGGGSVFFPGEPSDHAIAGPLGVPVPAT